MHWELVVPDCRRILEPKLPAVVVLQEPALPKDCWLVVPVPALLVLAARDFGWVGPSDWHRLQAEPPYLGSECPSGFVLHPEAEVVASVVLALLDWVWLPNLSEWQERSIRVRPTRA